jgi:YHS domain-containing protein
MSTTHELINTSGASGIALSGYDTVAFFTDHKPTHGSPSISAKHHGATYFFATEEHRKLFIAAPDKYLPQCGGFCAFGASVNALFPIDISTWQIVDGKLYFTLNPEIQKALNQDLHGNLAKAAHNMPELVSKHSQ